MKRWVQHINGDGPMLEVVNEYRDEWVVVLNGRIASVSKDEYRRCNHLTFFERLDWSLPMTDEAAIIISLFLSLLAVGVGLIIAWAHP